MFRSLGFKAFQGLAALLACAVSAGATVAPCLTLEDLVDRADFIVSGRIARSWSEWDAGHRYIWTHYELGVTDTTKGVAGKTVVISEPGGEVGGEGLRIAGAPVYAPGERVMVFLKRTPIGYYRTIGWGQGKYNITPEGRVRPAMAGAQTVEMNHGRASRAVSRGTPLRETDGLTLSEFRGRVSTMVRERSPMRERLSLQRSK